MALKITAISDTHGLHKQLNLNGGDVLIHAGDVSKFGNEVDIESFILWFGKQNYKHKIFIAGNHDFYFEENKNFQELKPLPDGVIYLENSGVEIDGVSFWGSPITPTFCDLAFNRDRGNEIANYWKKIPKNTDVLITHGPPNKILDRTIHDFYAGCTDLEKAIREIQPNYHIFGHIHESFGKLKKENTTYINASAVYLDYEIREIPYFDFEIE